MANTAVTTTNVIKLAKNVAVARPAGQAVTVGNTAVLTPQPGQVLFSSSDSRNKGFESGHLLVLMKETGSVATSVATVKAGVTGGTPANLAIYGDLDAIAFTSGQEKLIQLDLNRFLQSDGTVQIAVSGTAASVTFTIVTLDKSA